LAYVLHRHANVERRPRQSWNYPVNPQIGRMQKSSYPDALVKMRHSGHVPPVSATSPKITSNLAYLRGVGQSTGPGAHQALQVHHPLAISGLTNDELESLSTNVLS
jgi:hypothetical protein